ncbi:NRDE family protein [Puia dinghuensis]|uniref:ATP-grasp domain-containing protein n=1 Tax=Puia dinghuensis TaxID=1792502 RepID=A0A8J2XVI6_9BACT|nr:NRDE family protein [Puia dinghuensis]GGB12589.1 hypothetical protein GCM10011511_40270 [Puia dinghuensis]
MCTVTFIPAAGGFYLTSNRDESRSRSVAIEPQIYSAGGDELIYPKDPDAGGSWIVLKDKGVAGVLLNGAFVRHLRILPYRASRGVILLEIMRAPDPLQQFRQMDLKGIEPFTLVLYSTGKLWDCRWDGSRKHSMALNTAKPHIWSSATLYDDRTAKAREQWFEGWLRTTDRIAPDDVLGFHRTAGNGDVRNSLVMNRDGRTFTVSVTSIVMTDEDSRMIHSDLRSGQDSVATFGRSCDRLRPPKRTGWSFSRFWTRLTHWEYWPTHVVYGPIYPYWFWLSLKARSFFFFNAANPRIEYAGFTHERKSEIYNQIPGKYYPRTQLCLRGTDWAILKKQLESRSFTFPLIAKPDIGERGTQVSLVKTTDELEAYCRSSPVDFLVQEYIPYDNEVGIFYARIPGEPKGFITSIVGKELLAVTGDGRSTIRTLLRQTPRFHLQLPVLAQHYGDLLETVLPKGISHTLVPYGNHCRGAKFFDWTDRITPELTDMIDSVCRQIPDFYYGRLDIRFADWGSLLQGRKFSIIELNGAGSEPTHIYDPDHSLFFAWKEIIRHWRLLYTISLINARRNKISLMKTSAGLKMLKDHARYMKLLNR